MSCDGVYVSGRRAGERCKNRGRHTLAGRQYCLVHLPRAMPITIGVEMLVEIQSYLSPAIRWLLSLVHRRFNLRSELPKSLLRELVSWDRHELVELIKLPPAQTFIYAAETGALNLFKLYYQSDILVTYRACSYGQISILKLIDELGSDRSLTVNVKLSIKAAQEGHLEVLRWLHRRGCPWNEHVCDAAASYGRLEVLQWLRCDSSSVDPPPRPCPWFSKRCLRLARAYGRAKLVRWLESIVEC